MKPVKSNITETSEACTPISSNCVIWQGPDVPCLNLCSGDSVTDVVYKLATMVCEIADNAFDYTDIDIQCLLDGSTVAPTDREEFYQLIVDKLCEALQEPDPGEVITPMYTLPECLQYVDGDGNTIIDVTLEEYVQVIAEAVCDIYAAIDGLQTSIDLLDIRVTALESAVSTGGTPLINVTTQCASGPVPGAQLPVQQAFYNLETKFCALSGVLGTIAQLNAVILTECTDLDTEPTLMNGSLQMQDLPGWVVTPATVAENLNNLWLTICDMRSKIIDCCAAAVTSCVPVAPTNLTISSVTTTNAVASWFAPSFGTGEAPLEYLVQVYNEAGGNPTGAPFLTVSVPYPGNTTTLNTAALVEGRTYIIQVTAVYSCGESTPAQTAAVLRVSPAAMCIQVYESGLASGNITCNGIGYPVLNKRTFARLQNISGGTPVVNTGVAITVTVKYAVVNECGVTSSTTLNITIPNGAYEGYVDYVAQTRAQCMSFPVCNPVTQTLGCVESITGTTSVICTSGAAMCPPPLP
jgi:hypothetical protein